MSTAARVDVAVTLLGTAGPAKLLGARESIMEPGSSPSEEVSLAGRRVLLAEDDEITRKVMANILRQMGLDVMETSDGGRMLVAVAGQYKDGHSPYDLDLIVTDVNMPVVSGIDIFKGLRAAHWKTPVIVVTGYASPKVLEAIAIHGAVLMQKPLDLEEFEGEVRRLLKESACERLRPSSPP